MRYVGCLIGIIAYMFAFLSTLQDEVRRLCYWV